MFVQVFIRKSYAFAERMRGVRTIVDCGANVGYASACFLTLFPDAHLVAVEPDVGNYTVLERNLRSFGSRATAVKAAIWSHEANLRVVRGAYRDGEAWSFQVTECAEGEESDVRGLDMDTLMRENGLDAIDLLKVDIEGAETMLFADAVSWIRKVGTVIIELHDTRAHGVFVEAVKKSGRFVLSTDGELTIASPRSLQRERPDRSSPRDERMRTTS